MRAPYNRSDGLISLSPWIRFARTAPLYLRRLRRSSFRPGNRLGGALADSGMESASGVWACSLGGSGQEEIQDGIEDVLV
jgi:hypothetical protein